MSEQNVWVVKAREHIPHHNCPDHGKTHGFVCPCQDYYKIMGIFTCEDKAKLAARDFSCYPEREIVRYPIDEPRITSWLFDD